MKKKGVTVISEEDIPKLREGTVVIRSHGVGRRIYDMLKTAGISFVDVTCPFVLKIHRIVERGKQGRKTDYHILEILPTRR